MSREQPQRVAQLDCGTWWMDGRAGRSTTSICKVGDVAHADTAAAWCPCPCLSVVACRYKTVLIACKAANISVAS